MSYTMKNYLQNPRVRVLDIIPENPKFIFIAESPGTTEIYEGLPFSGNSGINMMRQLRKCGNVITGYTSFGEFIYRQQPETAFLNISQSPLQSKDIPYKAIKEKKFSQEWEKLRNSFETKYKNGQEDACSLYDNFSERIEVLLKNSSKVTVFTLGKTAWEYFDYWNKQTQSNITPVKLRHTAILGNKKAQKKQRKTLRKHYTKIIEYTGTVIQIQSDGCVDKQEVINSGDYLINSEPASEFLAKLVCNAYPEAKIDRINCKNIYRMDSKCLKIFDDLFIWYKKNRDIPSIARLRNLEILFLFNREELENLKKFIDEKFKNKEAVEKIDDEIIRILKDKFQ